MKRILTEEQKAAQKLRNAEWRIKNAEKKKLADKAYYQANREKALAYCKERYANKAEYYRGNTKKWRAENREQALASQAKWYAENREEVRAAQKANYYANRAEYLAQQKVYAQKNKEKISQRNKRYREEKFAENPDGVRKFYRERGQKWYTGKPQYRLRSILHARIRTALKKGTIRSGITTELIGCDIEWLMAWIEVNWEDGMTWENQGRYGWHIDHIKPCREFDLTDPVQQKQCFHWANLQPMWAGDNLRKGGKWDGEIAA